MARVVSIKGNESAIIELTKEEIEHLEKLQDGSWSALPNLTRVFRALGEAMDTEIRSTF